MSDQMKEISPGSILLMLFAIIGTPFLPLLISWQWDWWEAWVYAVVFILGFAVSRLLAARRNPDLIAERAHYMHQADAKAWDKKLSPMVGLGSGFIPLVAGLDALFSWSASFDMTTKLAALIIILAGFALASYALIENRFFSGMVRIQAERGHRVVSSGPYRWIRHPGYAGSLLAYLASPIWLDSAWAFLPAIIITILLFIRTYLEDKTLQDELDGYREYAGKVHFRLIPGIW
jgi:protein-S-isoprenylcysteine O-methyltransferase Ste14